MLWWEVIIRISAAMLIGGLVGTQREFKGNAAGLRTHTLVALGACIAMLTNEFLFRQYSEFSSMDIARMGSYVITGIGFLGAGSIIKDGLRVRGLTTAAGLWVVACLGIAVGAGFYLAAGFGTVLLIVTISALKWFEKKYIHTKTQMQISLQIKNTPGKLAEVLTKIGESNLSVCNIIIENSEGKWIDVYLTTNKIHEQDSSILGEKFDEMKGVKLLGIEI